MISWCPLLSCCCCFLTEFMTLVHKTIQALSVQLNNTSSAHCFVHPLPQERSLHQSFPTCLNTSFCQLNVFIHIPTAYVNVHSFVNDMHVRYRFAIYYGIQKSRFYLKLKINTNFSNLLWNIVFSLWNPWNTRYSSSGFLSVLGSS